MIVKLVYALQRLTGSVSRARAERRNPWPKCPGCFHRVPSVCLICEGGQGCGCCPGHDDDDEEDEQ